jgi:hypothetical protein
VSTSTFSVHDAAGNTLGYASNSYTFNQRGHMSQATVIGAATYVCNALGQLIEKSGDGARISFVRLVSSDQ